MGPKNFVGFTKQNYERNFKGCWTTEIANYRNSLKFVRVTHTHNAVAK